jgi:hypothetical protein
MGRYLVVAHQTAAGPRLREALQQQAAIDPGATFVVLVPATPVRHLLTWEEGETRAVAMRRAEPGGASTAWGRTQARKGRRR